MGAYKAIRMTAVQREALKALAAGAGLLSADRGQTMRALERKRLISWEPVEGTMRSRWTLTTNGKREAQRLGWTS